MLLNVCWQFGNCYLLNTCWQFCVLLLLNVCWQFGITQSLNSIDRVSSFYWTRGSKLCFLTPFSYFSCYFLTLVSSQNHYLLISLCLSWLHRNPISRPVFLYLWHSKVVRRTCAPSSYAWQAWHIAQYVLPPSCKGYRIPWHHISPNRAEGGVGPARRVSGRRVE